MKKLEAYKAFSVIAWTTVVLFSLFTYSIILDLREALTEIDEQLEEKQQIN